MKAKFENLYNLIIHDLQSQGRKLRKVNTPDIYMSMQVHGCYRDKIRE